MDATLLGLFIEENRASESTLSHQNSAIVGGVFKTVNVLRSGGGVWYFLGLTDGACFAPSPQPSPSRGEGVVIE